MFIMIKRKDLLGLHREAPKGGRCAWPSKYLTTRKGFVLTLQYRLPRRWTGPSADHKGFFCAPGLRLAIWAAWATSETRLLWAGTPMLVLWLISPLSRSSKKGSPGHGHLGNFAPSSPSQKFTGHISKEERLK